MTYSWGVSASNMYFVFSTYQDNCFDCNLPEEMKAVDEVSLVVRL